MAEAGLRDGHGKVEAGVELVAPVSEESALANAVWPTQKHEAAQGGTLSEMLVGLFDLRMVLLKVLGVITGEGDAGGSPLMSIAVECGVGKKVSGGVISSSHEVVWRTRLGA